MIRMNSRFSYRLSVSYLKSNNQNKLLIGLWSTRFTNFRSASFFFSFSTLKMFLLFYFKSPPINQQITVRLSQFATQSILMRIIFIKLTPSAQPTRKILSSQIILGKNQMRLLLSQKDSSQLAALISKFYSILGLFIRLLGTLLQLEGGLRGLNLSNQILLCLQTLRTPSGHQQAILILHQNLLSNSMPIQDFIQPFQQRKFTLNHSLAPPLTAYCSCSLCNVSPLLQHLPLTPKPPSDIQLVLKNICSPKHRQISGTLGVRISQTCFYEKGEPSCIYGNRKGLAIKEIKKGINNTLINKVFNENRRIYRDKLKLKYSNKEAVIIDFIGEYPQIFTEIQFLNLLNKRKGDPFWSTVNKIQNFTWTPCVENNRHFCYYFEGSDKGLLFKAAKNYIQSICGHYNISYKDYVSNQSEARFAKSLPKSERFQYFSYKIINFMQIIHQTDVKKLVLDLSLNQNDEMVLIDAFHFDGKQYPPLEWNQDIYYKRLQNQAEQILQLRPQHRQVNFKEEKLRSLQNQMYHHFKSLKFKFGLIEQQPKSEFAESDRAFNKLRPKARPLSLLIKQGITLHTFKKAFYPLRTKPQFNMMTTVLHKLTSHSKRRGSQEKGHKVSKSIESTAAKLMSMSVRL